MKKISLVVHKNNLEDTIKTLHKTGLMEIINIEPEEKNILETSEKPIPHPDIETCTNYELRLTRLIDILQKIKPKKTGLTTMFEEEKKEIKQLTESNIEETFSYAEGLLNEIEKKILEQEKKLNLIDEEKQKIKGILEQLKYIKPFNLNIEDIAESEYLFITAGRTTELNELKKEIEKIEHSEIFYEQFGHGKKIEWSTIIVALKKERQKIERISREYLEEFKLKGVQGTPKKADSDLTKRIKEIEKEKKQIKTDLKRYTEQNLNELYSTREEIQIEKVRKVISKNFAKTSYLYNIQGWSLEKNVDILQEKLEKITDEKIIIKTKTPSQNPDDPPTHLDTPRWANGFKSLLGMFSLPKYNEIDPTIIMGIFFVAFFGFMLGDAGYGLVILFLSLFGYIKLGKKSEMIHDWAFMGIWMGVVTTIVGFLTNSFFGDLIPRFIYNNPEQALYQATVFGIDLPLNTIKEPITILTIALIFGLIHLNIGIILALIQSYKHKNYKELLTTKSCWIPLQIGGGLLISNFILDVALSDTLFYISVALVIIGIIQLFSNAGPIGFFDITGYVGDWLSYARLLALGLATAGMALAFNVVSELFSEMIPIQILGIIIMIFLLVLMHLVNLALQALGAGVHSLRLQYVEFFNRFYEGGGHEFSPFKVNREYTNIDKDKTK